MYNVNIKDLKYYIYKLLANTKESGEGEKKINR